MAAACGLTIVKQFDYRGNPIEEFSNTYWLTGGAPTDAQFLALFDAIVAVEKTIYPTEGSGGAKVVRGYGYRDDSGHKPGDTGTVHPADWVHDIAASPVAGTLTMTDSDQRLPGDAAVWVRWKTSRRTDPGGKAIYLRKYFHPACRTTGAHDAVLPAQITALNALGALLDGGSLPDARKITTAGQTDVILSHAASSYVTTRTLKRRGKRPSS
jgi:hypothetical protein